MSRLPFVFSIIFRLKYDQHTRFMNVTKENLAWTLAIVSIAGVVIGLVGSGVIADTQIATADAVEVIDADISKGSAGLAILTVSLKNVADDDILRAVAVLQHDDGVGGDTINMYTQPGAAMTGADADVTTISIGPRPNSTYADADTPVMARDQTISFVHTIGASSDMKRGDSYSLTIHAIVDSSPDVADNALDSTDTLSIVTKTIYVRGI